LASASSLRWVWEEGEVWGKEEGEVWGWKEKEQQNSFQKRGGEGNAEKIALSRCWFGEKKGPMG